MSEKIITPQSILKEQLDEEIWLMGKALEQEALRKARSMKCARCGTKNNLKLVPLHEYPFPLPSRIVLYCANCKHNEAIMARDTDKMMKHYTEMLTKKAESILPSESRDNDKVIHDKALADKLISDKKTKK